VGYLSGFSCQTLDGGKFCVFSGSQLSLIIRVKLETRMNYKDDNDNLELEKEFLETARMLEETRKTAKGDNMNDTQMREADAELRTRILDLKEANTDLREEIARLKDEVKQLKDQKPKIRLTAKRNEAGDVFFADDFDWPVCYNCSTEKDRPVVLTIQTGAVFECTGCKAKYLYNPSSDPQFAKLKEEINIHS
jgi:hypothetical protein